MSLRSCICIAVALLLRSGVGVVEGASPSCSDVVRQSPAAIRFASRAGSVKGVGMLPADAPSEEARAVIAHGESVRGLTGDPIVAFSTYLGTAAEDAPAATGVDEDGSMYLAGRVEGSLFPNFSVNHHQLGPLGPNDNIFVTKLDANGAVVYSTVIGGSQQDYVYGLRVDSRGAVTIIGNTNSPDYPLQNPLQSARVGSSDVLVSRLSPDGAVLEFSTLLGGVDVDYGMAVDIDANGTVIVGFTQSPDFPTANPLFNYHPPVGTDDRLDGFVARIAPDDSSLVFSTFLGGTNQDECRDVRIGAGGTVTVVGMTRSGDFPTASAFQPVIGEGSGGPAAADGFVTRFSASGASLVFSTYLGGAASDFALGLDLDSANRCVVAGYTRSSDFPQIQPLQASFGGEADAFISILSANGATLDFSTWLGGSAFDNAQDVDVGPQGLIAMCGGSQSTNFPTINAGQPGFGGGLWDGVVVHVEPVGSGFALAMSTYIGGGASDAAVGVVLDQSLTTYVAGNTQSLNFPVYQAADSSFNGPINDAFAMKLAENVADLAVALNVTPDPPLSDRDLSYVFTIDNDGPETAANVGVRTTTPVGAYFLSASPPAAVQPPSGGAGPVTWRLGTLGSGETRTFTLTVRVTAPPETSLSLEVSTTTASADPDLADNSATSVRTVANPPVIDIAVSKAHSGTFVAGSTAEYLISVVNVGTMPTSGPVQVVDDLPAGIAFAGASGDGWQVAAVGQRVTASRAGALAPGAMAAFQLTVNVGVAAVPEITNVVTVTTPGDSNVSNDSASDRTSVRLPSADLLVSVAESPDPAVTGGQLVYSVTVSNLGPEPALNVLMSTAVPAGTAFAIAGASQGEVHAPQPGASGAVTARIGTLQSGHSSLVTIGVAVTAPAGSVISFSATVASDSIDMVPANNGASAATGVVTPTLVADLEVVASSSPSTVRVGGSVTYSVVLTNQGPDAASEVHLLAPLPAQSLFEQARISQGILEAPPRGRGGLVRILFGSIPSGASASAQIEVRVTGPPGEISSTFGAAAASSDPDLENNAAAVVVLVTPAGPPPAIEEIAPLVVDGRPFRIKVSGSNFADGVMVYVGDDTQPWSMVRRKSDTVLVLGKGRGLKERFPRGVAVRIVVRNPDGAEANRDFLRP